MEHRELITDIIDMELYKAEGELEEEMEEINPEYSEVSDMTENIKNENESLVRDQKIPAKEIIDEVSVTNMVIDLSMASIAKQASVKLLKMETFLGKIEDRLFSDKSLDGMSKGDLAALYTSTRMMRTDAFRMLKDIKKDVDFGSLEDSLLSLHSKASLKEGTETGEQMKSILQTLMADDSFLKTAEKNQKKNMEENK